MVVKMNEPLNPPKQYIGNQQEINIKCNNCETTIIGNKNKISVDVNDGQVNVIGNHCTVRMNSGSGSVSYTGNYGNVFHGDGVLEQQIVNIGDYFKLGGKDKPSRAKSDAKTPKARVVNKPVRRIRVNYVNISF